MRAQDACIGALEPVSQGRPPSLPVVREALDDAEAAAAVDDRWSALRAILHRLLEEVSTGAAGPSLDALVEECDRVNEIVRRGGREPSSG